LIVWRPKTDEQRVYTTEMSWIRICILLLTISCSACIATAREMHVRSENEQGNTIYLVNHGWHAGIVLLRADISESIWPATVGFSDAQYLEIGWGDKDYYQTLDPHLGLTLKAALLPTASVLHIVGFNQPVQTYFPYSEIIKVELSSAGFEYLTHAIAASFAMDEASNTISLGPGLYGSSRFYLSRETYHLFNSCNVWTARVLQVAGLAITPAYAIRVENLMSQVRKFGMVLQTVQEFSE